MTSRRTRARAQAARGNAVLEFALAFSLLVPLFTGCIEFGFAFYRYEKLLTAVRAGARYASRLTYDSASEAPTESYLTAVRNMVVYGNPEGTGSPIVPGLEPEDVIVEVEFELGYPRWVTVGVGQYQQDSIVKLLDFRNKPRLRMPYVGRFDPL